MHCCRKNCKRMDWNYGDPIEFLNQIKVCFQSYNEWFHGRIYELETFACFLRDYRDLRKLTGASIDRI
jgi:hypothetical protein